MNLARAAYNTALTILSPAAAAWYLHRVFVSGKSRESWKQQLGMLSDIPERTAEKPRIWVQAVSVGETVASVPIVAAIKEILPNSEIFFSTTTTTGQKVAQKSVKSADKVFYFPIDFPFAVNRSLRKINPDVFVSIESEIWPNFLQSAKKYSVKTAIVNGIVSDKTMKRSGRILWLYRWALSCVDVFCMQSTQDMERIIKLGAPKDRVTVKGNCKFDEPVPMLNAKERTELRRRFKLDDLSPIFVAGSTNPGEDEPVLDAFKAARDVHPNLKMILAPRQIERAQEIADMAAARGLFAGFRSRSEELTGNEDVILLDTLGELATVYSIAEVAFVGGNLIKKGGHNILQPIAHGKPVFFGPYTFKCRDIVRMAKESGVGFEISGADDLGKELTKAVGNKTWLTEIERKAEKLMTDNRGASRRCAEAVASLIERVKV